MAEAEVANPTGVKHEVVEQVTHVLASKLGAGVRKMLQNVLPSKVLGTLGEHGLAELVTSVIAVIARIFVPDTPKGELIKDFITEFMDEVSDLDENRKATAASSASGSHESFRGAMPAVTEFREKIFSLTHALVKKYGQFIQKFLTKYGEEEAEEFLKWLNTLARLELEAFIVMDDDARFAYWDAKEHPLEKKRLRDKALLQWNKPVTAYREFDRDVFEAGLKQDWQLRELKERRNRQRGWRARATALAFFWRL